MCEIPQPESCPWQQQASWRGHTVHPKDLKGDVLSAWLGAVPGKCRQALRVSGCNFKLLEHIIRNGSNYQAVLEFSCKPSAMREIVAIQVRAVAPPSLRGLRLRTMASTQASPCRRLGSAATRSEPSSGRCGLQTSTNSRAWRPAPASASACGRRSTYSAAVPVAQPQYAGSQVICDEHGVDGSGSYAGDSDLQLERVNVRDHHPQRLKIRPVVVGHRLKICLFLTAGVFQ